ncbi:hypothetical protein SHXM_06480 [Streptomyces hygroscopicus]|nr:hypothetical protein SHXM_06480 [Streptomyces hygroscopicus]
MYWRTAESNGSEAREAAQSIRSRATVDKS